MSPRDFAAMLICNSKQRFQISVFVNWTWKPVGYPPTQPWDLRIGAVQGHSNQTVDQIKLSIHMIFNRLLHLKNHVVLEGFFMSQVQEIYNPFERKDS